VKFHQLGMLDRWYTHTFNHSTHIRCIDRTGRRSRNLDEKFGQSDLPDRTLGDMILEETHDDSQGQANRQAAEESRTPPK